MNVLRRSRQVGVRRPPLSLCALILLLIALLWILFVGGTRRNEIIVGTVVLSFSSAFLYQVWRIETLNVDFSLKDLAQGWRIPWYVVTDSCIIVAILLRDLLTAKRAGSFYRVSRFKTSESDARLVARRVLATFYSTMTPNSIIIGIDSRQNRMLVHQLKRSSISKMIQALKAQPGDKR